MTLPSVRLLADALYGLLDGGTFPVYRSRVTPTLTTDRRGVVKGHAVLHPVRPSTERTSLSGQPGAVWAAFQVDCVGGSDVYVLGVVDQVIALVDGKTVTVAGSVVGLIQPPLGYQPPAPYHDPGAAPYQVRLPLQYVVMAVPA